MSSSSNITECKYITCASKCELLVDGKSEDGVRRVIHRLKRLWSAHDYRRVARYEEKLNIRKLDDVDSIVRFLKNEGLVFCGEI